MMKCNPRIPNGTSKIDKNRIFSIFGVFFPYFTCGAIAYSVGKLFAKQEASEL